MSFTLENKLETSHWLHDGRQRNRRNAHALLAHQVKQNLAGPVVLDDGLGSLEGAHVVDILVKEV